MEMLLPSSKQFSSYYHLHDVHLDNVVHIPVQQYQLPSYMHWGLGACHTILRVSLSTCDNTAEKYVTAFDSGVHLQNWPAWTPNSAVQ
jgi:hypothetical protein